jgi:hypothetical protein
MEISGRHFNQKEVNRIFSHIPSKTLRWWAIRSLYGWANEVADGRGIHREYELVNLYQIGIVEELASLNIPTLDMQIIMNQHFHYGLGMDAPNYLIPTELMVDRWPSANVDDQMKKMLVIAKRHAGFWVQGGTDRKKDRLVVGWRSFLVPQNKATVAGLGKEDVVTLIFIDLQVIKRNVDSWVSY